MTLFAASKRGGRRPRGRRPGRRRRPLGFDSAKLLLYATPKWFTARLESSVGADGEPYEPALHSLRQNSNLSPGYSDQARANRRIRTLSSSPTPKADATSDDPPYDTNGKGSPVIR